MPEKNGKDVNVGQYVTRGQRVQIRKETLFISWNRYS